MANVTFKQVKSPDPKQLQTTLVDGGRAVLNAEMKRIAKNRFRPLVRGWTGRSRKNQTAGNRPSFRTKTTKRGLEVNAQITVTDAEDDKPLFKWVHMTGTRPHVIRSTKAHGLLVFQARSGQTVFTRKPINHPGFKSSGEHDKILLEEPPKIKDELETIIGGKFVAISR